MTIREYDDTRDRPALRECFIALQESERALMPELPQAADVADDYLERMFELFADLSPFQQLRNVTVGRPTTR